MDGPITGGGGGGLRLISGSLWYDLFGKKVGKSFGSPFTTVTGVTYRMRCCGSVHLGVHELRVCQFFMCNRDV